MWQPGIDNWIIIVGVLCATSCALLGNFLVLRQMSMMGDAISHAVLPGLAVAFLLTDSRASFVMFLGAAVVGVLTALFTQWVHSFGKVDRGASMGVVFTTLFAIGLILIVRAADRVDLDPGCVLYGAIELAPLDRIELLGWSLPRAAVVLAAILLFNSSVVLLLYKELKISSFDPALATTLGINARAMHYLLMTLVAITTVASFEAIGSILVIAMLIVPAAAAHLLTDRLHSMILVSLVLAAMSAAGGHVAAITVPKLFGFVDTTTAGMMAVVAGAIFAVIMLLAPRHGVISRIAHRLWLRLRILREDVLGLLYRLEEASMDVSSRELPGRIRQMLGASAAWSAIALAMLRRQGLVARQDGRWELTPSGRSRALHLVRSHRLWESYFVEHAAVAPDHVHPTAMALEHVTGDRMREQLAEEAQHPEFDPHGKSIPPGEG